jgi:hypothetical protein
MTQFHPSVMSEARLKDDVFRVIRKKVDKATAFSAAKAGPSVQWLTAHTG